MNLLCYLYPASLDKASPDATYDALDTGAWVSTDYAAIDDLQGAPDGDVSLISHGWGPSSGYATRYRFASYRLTAPPPGIAITKITVRAVVTNACSNSVPVDGDFRVFVVTAAGATRTLGAANTIAGLRASEYAVDQEWRTIEYGWTTNPSTGLAWTRSDLADLRVGVRTLALTDPLSSSNPTAMVTSLYVEVEAVSTVGDVEQIRHVGSHVLRLRRLRMRTCSLELPARLGERTPGSAIWIAHKGLPTPDGLGSGVAAWRRAPFLVTRRERSGGGAGREPIVRLELLDLTGVACRLWSPLVTDLACDEQGSGIAMLHQGQPMGVARAATGYARRPDGLWTGIGANIARYHKDLGLLVSGPGAVSGLTYDTFSAFAGGAFTGWTSAVSGTGAVQDGAEYLFDVTGLRRSLKLNCPAGGDTASVSQVWGNDWTTDHRMILGVKALGHATNPPHFRLEACADGASWTHAWDFDWGAWRAIGSVPWWTPGGAWVAGERWEYWSPVVQPPVAGYVRLQVGCVSGAVATGTVFAATILRDDGAGTGVAPHEFEVTGAAGSTSVGDAVHFPNDSPWRVWDVTRGEVNVQFTPLWGHTDLLDGQEKVVLQALHATTGGERADTLLYARTSASAGRWIFRRTAAAGTVVESIYSVGPTTAPERLVTVRLAARWTSADAELDLPAFSHQVFVGGVAGSTVQLAALPTQLDGEDVLWLGRSQAGVYADGYLRHLEVRDWCPRDAEIRRWQG